MVQMLESLFGEEVKKAPHAKRVGQSSKITPRGCDFCPSKGKTQIFGAIQGKDILIFGMRPAAVEEAHGLPFVGKSGKLLWRRAEKLKAFTRSQCDVDNVVRCRGTEETESGGTREVNPTKQELHCCSLHTETQLAKAKPKVILLLGEVAQKQFLGKKYNKKKIVYWDEERNCRIICTYHPSYLLRHAPVSAWKIFDSALRMVKFFVRYPGKYGYLETQDYKFLDDIDEIKSFFKEAENSEHPVVFDLEDGWNDPVSKTRRVILMIGFCFKPGIVRVILLDHPLRKKKEGADFHTASKWLLVKRFFESSVVHKSAWKGVSDVRKLWKIKKIRVKNFSVDAMFSEYLAYPERKDYRLAKTAEVRFPQFVGWKEIVDPYLKEDKGDFGTIPPKVLFWRNAGDCDVTFRALSSTLTKKNRELVKMYTSVDSLLDRMADRGILLDEKHTNYLLSIYEPLMEKIDAEISLISGNPDFKVTNDNLRWLLIEKLKLPLSKLTKGGEQGKVHGFKSFAVGKDVLEELEGGHPVIRKILVRRFIEKLKGTHLLGFKKSAEVFGGYVKTRFKLTGTSTGRMSSGGDRDKKSDDVKHVNFQNIHGDKSAQNILVSTLRWREIEKACLAEKRRQE